LHTSDGQLDSLGELMVDFSIWNENWGNLTTS